MPEMFENKAKFATNSRAIGKDFNAVIGHFRCERRVHDSIRASLVAHIGVDIVNRQPIANFQAQLTGGAGV